MKRKLMMVMMVMTDKDHARYAGGLRDEAGVAKPDRPDPI
jgi:hypothetical protein